MPASAGQKAKKKAPDSRGKQQSSNKGSEVEELLEEEFDDEPSSAEDWLYVGLRSIMASFILAFQGVTLMYFCLLAYRIRMRSVADYGYLIHEFDPWFNFRATEYLAAHGAERFFKWYDYMSWYPIGRPIGTTIYPGMQFVAVWLWQLMAQVPEGRARWPAALLAVLPKWTLPANGKEMSFGPMSLNDVCVVTPAWFGALATFLTFLLTLELSRSTNAALVAAGVMSIIPAHLMRSMAGEFDNEAVAVAAFCAVLWFWVLSLRSSWSWPVGLLTGIAYAAAAATWGGYIFLNNLIALHTAVLVFLGKYSSAVHRAYSLQWLVGTVLAVQVPVIGFAPLRSVEQMPSLLVFLGLQVMEACDWSRARFGAELQDAKVYFRFRVRVFSGLGLVGLLAVFVLAQAGVFMPLGARIRGLFLETTKTGNPLVDSVSEHQPSNEEAYDTFLGSARHLAAFGMLFCWHQDTPAKFLVPVYATVAYHYSLKMSRLMIICGPIAAVLAGYGPGMILDWCLEQVLRLAWARRPPRSQPAAIRTGGMGSFWRWIGSFLGPIFAPAELTRWPAQLRRFGRKNPMVDTGLRLALAITLLLLGSLVALPETAAFYRHCMIMSDHMASPQLVFKTQLRDGTDVLVDDYMQGYKWLRDNTPEDARVMAWWDYGYQITGVANRTSIADGNTWNHEHIAMLGKIMTSPEKLAHKAMRHMADYALVWAGGAGGDDMAKSPHLARIGNSVFPDHCGDADPLCNKFSFHRDGTPTKMMAQSFLYKAVMADVDPAVQMNPKLFQEVHSTKYGLMRIWKVLNVSEESKAWVADPRNRECDAPGSWYCVGQYPPALAPLLKKRRNFAQLEDFNKDEGEKSAYTRHIEQMRSKQQDL
eukprot:CAMPEP_0178383268 /NCGR_PEP_ID=MMETSP0689_2-20121128/6915_1 /TAXON_ID=160604 /ORGANISM="Amphidinium massartii, Strain CS-259" /LENGTH=870 /DNA_ID=CAMNT_0020003485 /DNA_START=56 /DNA_END=2668 /DNA_ORIENTATION=+